MRARLLAEQPGHAIERLVRRVESFDHMFPLGNPPDYAPPRENSIAAIAKREGRTPQEVAYDLMLDDGGHAMLFAPGTNYAYYNLDVCREFIEHPQALVSLSDGGAHVAHISDDSFSTYLLTHWGRDFGHDRLDVSWLVKRMTGDTAQTVGLCDRGILAPGFKADINVIDLDRLRIERPYMVHDLPLSSKRLLQKAQGYVATIVSGETIDRDGEATKKLPGDDVASGNWPSARKIKAAEPPISQRITAQSGALKAPRAAWPKIVEECRQVLGSELHYQAMIYHCLRQHGGVPIRQIGMNVKMYMRRPLTEMFRVLEKARHLDFQGGFEPIPDVVVFKPGIEGDWRRRVFLRGQMIRYTIQQLLMVIEVKASERLDSRLQRNELLHDIRKLASQRKEINYRRGDFLPVMLIVDTAPLPNEQMSKSTLEAVQAFAADNKVLLFYLSPDRCLPVARDQAAEVMRSELLISVFGIALFTSNPGYTGFESTLIPSDPNLVCTP
jgi:hypothetical protein